MPIESRSEAQRRTDEIRAFQRELEDVARRGILVLTDEQRSALERYHGALLTEYERAFDVDRDVKAKQLSIGMRITSLIGALALAASIFFLFYQFWGLFSAPTQVAILVVASLGTFVGTIWIWRKDGSGYFTKLAAMVAFACFVLNIVMLGQIFNITPSDKALLPWAALALLLAYTADLRLLLVAGLLCVVAFIGSRMGTISGMYWLYFGERPENFFPAAIVLFFVPQWLRHDRFAGFAATYRILALLTLFLPMLVLANWGQLSHLPLDATFIKSSYQVLGFVLGALVTWYGVRRGWNHVVNAGVAFFLIFLYTKFFDWWWESMPKYLFFLVVAMTAVLFLLVFRRVRRATSSATGIRT
jgi:uncharacterized membrane protein